jgi:CO/xanthine dehydrogenase FAD-binding subunit
MVHRIAHTQVRNVGSIGGNLMLANKHSFPSDLMIALMGLGGSVIVGYVFFVGFMYFVFSEND